MSTTTWYYAQDNQQKGPLTLEELQGMAAQRQLQATTLVWTAGMAQWLPASAVPEFAPYYGAQPQAQTSIPSYAPPGIAPVGMVTTPLNYHGQYSQPQTPTYVAYAGFWWRFLAFIVDFIIVVIGNQILAFIVGFITGLLLFQSHVSHNTLIKSAGVAAVMMNIVADWLYFALQEASAAGATIGKRVVSLRVTDLNGNRISFGQAAGRHFGKIISLLIFAVGFMMAGFTKRKQALHDIMAGTLVMKAA